MDLVEKGDIAKARSTFKKSYLYRIIAWVFSTFIFLLLFPVIIVNVVCGLIIYFAVSLSRSNNA